MAGLLQHLAHCGGDGIDPDDFVRAQGDGRIQGVQTGENDRVAVICGAIDAEEDVSSQAVAEACDDAVAGVRHAVGIEDGQFAIVVLRKHRIARQTHGERIGIIHAEGKVFGGGEGCLRRGCQFACGRDGQHGQGGDAW